MKGDFSKKTFDAQKHYKDVNMQQGRVLLDTDWNEQNDIASHRIETETVDTFGSAGAPMHAAGFEIITVDNAGNPVASNGVDLKISAGRFYTDGILCENETTIFYKDQPDFLTTLLPSQAADAGDYMFYLDVWERHITAFEDAAIREVALNGADTTTRTKTIWQLKYKKMAAPVTCLTDIPGDVLGPSDAQRGKVNAKTEAGSSTGGPCGLVTSGGYKGLANQLYRVEIHKGGNRAAATFKWSRENASVLATWGSIDAGNPNNLIVRNPGRDDLLGFKSGDWVELIGDRTDLLIKPGVLVKLASVEGNVLTIDPLTIKDPEGSPGTAVARIFGYKNQRIRRWDMQKDKTEVEDKGEINVNKAASIELEDGIKVEFTVGEYFSGDYWLIPARTADAKIEWPFTTPQLPLGIKHHFAKLAICTLSFSGEAPQWTRVSDCRPIFPPLTELTSLYYVGGDGQEAMPGKALPNTLKVGVANGYWAVAGSKVKFEILAPGSGVLSAAGGIVTTNAQGIAECGLTLGTIPPNVNFSLQVKASLLDAAGNVMTNHLPVIFTAGFSDAANVSYTGGDCNNWGTTKPTTVADALTALCKRESGKGCSVTVGSTGQFKTLEEAFKALEEEKNICICLLPSGKMATGESEHVVKELVVEDKESIEISGCGAIVRLFGKIFALSAGKIMLNDIDFAKADEISMQVLLQGNEVSVHNCNFGHEIQEIEKRPILVGILRHKAEKALTVLRWNHNRMNTSYILALARGVQGSITNNEINGDLMLMFTTKFFDLKWQDIDPSTRKIIESKFRSILTIEDLGEILQIHGNIIGRIRTNTGIELNIPIDFQQLPNVKSLGYESVIVSENIIIEMPSSFIGKSVSLLNNHFKAINDAAPVFAMGFDGVLMGNICPISTSQVETLFHVGRKIIQPNLCNVN